MNSTEQQLTFLEVHKEGLEALGFWSESYRTTIVMAIENLYKPGILKEWHIADFVPNGDKVLVKWAKRIFPLSDKEINEKYGIAVEK